MKRWIIPAAAMLLIGPSWAAQQSAVLSVPGMNCPTCPITVKLALTRIDGVIDVKSNLPKRETTVVFDSAKVKVEALTSATKNAGFPSTVVSVNP
ncbi:MULTISPECIES: mercury resistance system periplasmic binding protein MerP [Comamonadaceae]|uniref:Periplasmic mercury ion-binding protein n=2 Tax=Comamonadaceae TaxID=80864 RepID=A0A6G8IK25_9BURK|nr:MULTISPECIES: mercury resistance system periplasmic binding protein MerP [Comamonadaceae]MDH0365247.1 mercury resistance system periplasmic binding protein MerP [Comamonas aquatica]MDH1764964.1 mercury resistance system periplasmic binding protein MerP [Comamonas aquatica]MDH1766354.1 mercury resistance system periplasmic binding protein MerP [Comamonas aquatica]MDH1767640.1 mercury resistance system periplasmic binding protein MerP [Comamonas aquatica]MDQ7747476.1 mercury resistance system